MKKHFIIIIKSCFHLENLVYYLQIFLKTDLNLKKVESYKLKMLQKYFKTTNKNK